MAILRFRAKFQQAVLLELVELKGNITGLSLVDSPVIVKETSSTNPILLQAKEQILEYLAGKRKNFDLPLSTKGTSFQEKVWSALQNIPYGEGRSYKDIAVAIGDKNAALPVGQANSKNPLPLLVPCHRVTGMNGKLTGYSFGGVETQRFLLELEEKYKSQ